MTTPLSLRLYAAATALLAPVVPAILRRRAHAGKEDPARMSERLGRTATPRPEGPLVWLHGASVGETLSLLPLVERLRAARPDIALLVTSGTATSAALMAQRLPAGVIHQYLPVDTPGAARRFLDHWRPGLVVFAESELWPNLILAAKARGAKLALVSARITDKSARGWAKAPAAARALFSAFDLILPQDAGSAERIADLGGRVGPVLNMKFAAEPLPFDVAELDRLRCQIGARKVVLAASTHPGEDELIAAATAALADPPLLILAPRHPQRGAEIAAKLAPAALRSAADPITPATAVYVADTLGELGLLYRLADVAVVGGSFIGGVGGHNPLEPARLAVPVVTGHDIANFRDVYQGLLGAGALMADTPDQLAAHLVRLLGDATQAKGMGEQAQAFAAAEGERLEATLAALDGLLPS